MRMEDDLQWRTETSFDLVTLVHLRYAGRRGGSLLNAQCKFTEFESKILHIFEDERNLKITSNIVSSMQLVP